MPKINFKYHPNVWDQDIFKTNKDGITITCQCCGNETDYYTDMIYSAMNIDCICPNCVASGRAAEKFNGSFSQDGEVSKVNDESKIEELFCHTPGYISWQGEYWLACCNDFCAYIGDVGTKELEELGIADEVFEEYDGRDEYDDARKYLVKEGSLAGYLFKCLHCQKYHLWVDAC